MLRYLPGLVDHFAVCDVAVVQGGLSTTMELIREIEGRSSTSRCGGTSSRTCRVRHRLDGYGAVACLKYAGGCDPDALSAAVVGEIRRIVDDMPVETDDAARAPELIGTLL